MTLEEVLELVKRELGKIDRDRFDVVVVVCDGARVSITANGPDDHFVRAVLEAGLEVAGSRDPPAPAGATAAKVN